eukprot:gene20956-27809_t
MVPSAPALLAFECDAAPVPPTAAQQQVSLRPDEGPDANDQHGSLEGPSGRDLQSLLLSALGSQEAVDACKLELLRQAGEQHGWTPPPPVLQVTAVKERVELGASVRDSEDDVTVALLEGESPSRRADAFSNATSEKRGYASQSEESTSGRWFFWQQSQGTDSTDTRGQLGFKEPAAMLMSASPESVMSQPYNLIGGQTLSALIGVCVRLAFQGHLRWLSTAVALSLSAMAMQMTRTMHPPAGATAAIACWMDLAAPWYGFQFMLIALLGTAVLLVVALAMNNLAASRRYPNFWF